MSDQLPRRRLLLGTAALGLALGAGMTGCDRGDRPAEPAKADAYRPWQDWPDRAEPGTPGLVQAAILAANAHNTQPWRFCVAPERIDLFADESRNLGAMDPFRREMRISLGCALANLILAARARGWSPSVDIDAARLDLPEGNPSRRVATIRLTPSPPAISPLLAAIPHRHTNRAPYEPDRAIGADRLAPLTALADQEPGLRLILLGDAGARRDFAAATVDATRAIIADAVMIGDSDAWFRASDRDIARHRDGPTIDAAGLPGWKRMLAQILPEPSPERSHSIWLDLTTETQLATAPLFGMIAVRDLYDQRQAVAAGLLWQRLHLQATTMGLAMQPLNQLAERVDRERQLGLPADTTKLLTGLTGDAAWLPTFLFRAGWPVREAPASPRREIAAVIRPETC
jgi:hypothetical protein